MKTPQLLSSIVLAGVIGTVACSRAETNAERAAERVNRVAVRAGEQLADSWLTTKVQAQYFADEDVKARHINVSTRDGVVTLTGRVDTAEEREEAVQIAKNTDGVRQVDDRLHVISAGQTASGTPVRPERSHPVGTTGSAPEGAESAVARIDDARTTAAVQSKFFVDERVKGRRIEVDTRRGVVTLSGEVASEEERAQALLLARTTEGVQRVEDHLTVNPAAAPVPAVADERLVTTIQARFFIDERVKAGNIDVSAKDGVVLLQGTVRDEAARQQALSIAQNTEGVVQVVDRLQVEQTRRR